MLFITQRNYYSIWKNELQDRLCLLFTVTAFTFCEGKEPTFFASGDDRDGVLSSGVKEKLQGGEESAGRERILDILHEKKGIDGFGGEVAAVGGGRRRAAAVHPEETHANIAHSAEALWEAIAPRWFRYQRGAVVLRLCV
ncbi:MAG: hypothetical protein LBQ33_02410 [Oscillospiraceae bacterium]|jgi:hypothetical protein|nr:hypothetical protein [Oscillospiraceae bacterium]